MRAKPCERCGRSVRRELVDTVNYKVANKSVVVKTWKCTRCGHESKDRKML